MPDLLLDTHITIRWMFDQKKLSKNQGRWITRAVTHRRALSLSAMSLIEIAVLSSQGRFEASLKQIFDALTSGPVMKILPVTFEIAAETSLLTSLRDPADRAIVATARVHGMTLVTSDQRIIESGLVPTVD